MDYEKEYNYYYDSYFKKIENRVKEYYQTNFDDIEYFGVAHDALRKWLEAFPDKKLDFKTDNNLSEILKIFDNKGLKHKLNQNRIDKNKNIIQLFNKVLIDSIKPYAEEIYKKEPLKKYKLKNILIRIALLKVVEDINRLLQTHNAFFQMIYEQNKFDKFMIMQYDRQTLEQTELYKTLRQKKYPTDETIRKEKAEQLAKKVFKNNGLKTFSLLVENYEDKKNKAFYSHLYHYLQQYEFQMINSNKNDNNDYKNYIALLDPRMKMSKITPSKPMNDNTAAKIRRQLNEIIRKSK